jgi:DNA-binding transcriptional MerR regulator
MSLLLTTYRKRTDFTIDELVAVAGDLLRQSAVTQTRWKVGQIPDVRTVRFYSSTGLLPKPLDYRGSAALFGYRHLLTLLAIKNLQAQFLPLQEVRKRLAQLDEEGLEQLVQPGIPIDQTDWGTRRESATDNKARPRSRGKPESSTPRPQSPVSASMEPAPQLPGIGDAAPDASTWERLEVEPGLELQVRSNYAGAKSASAMNALLSKIRVLLEARQGRKATRKAAPEEDHAARNA